jgi:hypothetical protein
MPVLTVAGAGLQWVHKPVAGDVADDLRMNDML